MKTVCLRGLMVGALAGTPVSASDLAWPDATIAIPPFVERFIEGECRRYAGSSEETIAECRDGERYGYRAVVGMLTDPERGERAAEKYRSCQVGLGDLGGRFHRRRAECMGYAFRLVWRFEFSREASLGVAGVIIEAASLGQPSTNGSTLDASLE